MSSESEWEVLKFAAWQSVITADFWHTFANFKLDILRLNQRPLQIQGHFAPCSHGKISQPMVLAHDSLSLELEGKPLIGDRNRCPAPGTLHNTNTKDEYKALDKTLLLKSEAEKLWDDILSGRAEEDPRLLNRFLVTCYADLKDWKFEYRFCFPALQFPQPVKCKGFQPASEFFAPESHSSVVTACSGWRASASTSTTCFFLLHNSTQGVTVRPLSDWEKCQQDGKVLLGFYDPTFSPKNPGWPLRNFLVLAAARWSLKTATIFCFRELHGRTDLKHCYVTTVSLEAFGGKDVVPAAVGWQGDAGSIADLASSMDPTRLAIAAADLNLKLMKWRFLPSLDIELLSKTRCLLLGAGTLGCTIALELMAWGVRDITFVDYGKVSYSNPLRQTLYTIEDFDRRKADAAPEALRRKCVNVRAKGHHLAIPMAGHSIAPDQVPEVLNTVNELKTLIAEHDIIFLLTDTRESRWLPTVLCAASDTPKIVINAALGFDSFVVLRHGVSPFNDAQNPRLGCYFCNDVVAPTNSTANRTLDQQCTVSRPGLAPIASSVATEMAVSVLHHPLGTAAAADSPANVNEPTEQPFGLLPHQIRGFLSHYAQLPVTGLAFERCTACSSKVVSEVKKRGSEFILEALNSPTFLEDLTGLTELLEATKSLTLDWDGDVDSDVADTFADNDT